MTAITAFHPGEKLPAPRRPAPHPEIVALLDRLRTRIRRYVLAEGAALVLVVLALLFWFSLAIDWLYFEAWTLELPVWFRKSFMVATFCLFALSVAFWVVLRAFRGARAKALALVLERRFPELNDRLITAVELAESTTGRETEMTLSMLHRTVDDVVEATRRLELDAVFNRAPLRRAVVAAVVLLASIAGLAAVNAPAFARWQRAYLAWDDTYWNRETELAVKVVAQPGDRIVEFQNDEYRHPRGADLALLVETLPGRTVPDHVQLRYEIKGRDGSARVRLSKFGDSQFRHTISGLLDDLTLSVQGGDYANRRPLRVIVVDPPRVDGVVLQCDYPDYTGLDAPGAGSAAGAPRQAVEVQGTQASLPMGTDFLLEAHTNKPLRDVRIQTEQLEIHLSPTEARLAVASAEGQPAREVTVASPPDRPFIDADGMRFRVPFVLAADAAARLKKAAAAVPIALPTDNLLRIWLHDEDDVVSIEPTRFTINAILDRPPAIQTELQGVGTSITRKAVVPVAGLIADDYGLAVARFDFKVDGEEQWRARPFHASPEASPKQFPLKRADDQNFERFEVLPLDLAVGQKLTLTVFAQDGDNLNGPHSSRGEQYAFQIVSDEELLSLLYARELNLRRRFEQIINEMEDSRRDLILHRTRVQEGLSLRKTPPQPGKEKEHDAQLRELDTAVAVCAERALHQIRKDAGETAAVEDSFKAILDELVNNAVHTRKMVDRIEERIVAPLSSINQSDFPGCDKALGLFKLANDKQTDPTVQIDESVQELGTMIAHMKAVLGEMEDLVKFHEAVKRLKAILDDEKRVGDDTQELRKKKRLKELKGLQ